MFVFTHNTLCGSSPEINSGGEEMKGTQVETRTASFLPILRCCPIRTEIGGTLALLLACNDVIMCNDVVMCTDSYKDMFDKLFGLSKPQKISFYLQNCGSCNRIVVCCKVVKTGIVSNVYGIVKPQHICIKSVGYLY